MDAPRRARSTLEIRSFVFRIMGTSWFGWTMAGAEQVPCPRALSFGTSLALLGRRGEVEMSRREKSQYAEKPVPQPRYVDGGYEKRGVGQEETERRGRTIKESRKEKRKK
jgi:hypothetical protein